MRTSGASRILRGVTDDAPEKRTDMQSTILDHAISPAAAVDALALRGVHVSERTLREKARKIGAYRQIGRAIFFMPADLERIIQPDPQTASSPTSDLDDARDALQRRKREKEFAANEMAALRKIAEDLKRGRLGKKPT